MKVLIVDDIATNREILRERFEAECHTTLEAVDGVEALQILGREDVDVVLSDILMPRMDGYRLCHEIRTSDKLRGLPIVIYTSSYILPSDKNLALTLGADKYLTKPAPFEALLVALREAIATAHTTQPPEAWQEVEVLKEYSDRLVAKLEERNVELAETNERLTVLDRAKTDFLNLISHEFRTPLSGLLSVGDLILEGVSSAEENVELHGAFERSRRRILAILDDALLLSQIDLTRDKFESTPVPLSEVLIHAIESTTDFADSRNVTIAETSKSFDLVQGDQYLLPRAFHALLETAVKFCEEGGTVSVAHQVVADAMNVTIEGHGRTISATALPRFFEIFSVGETLTPGGDLGLRPPVASRILSLFGAAVSVANLDSHGIRLTISLRTIPARTGKILLPPVPARSAGAAGR